MLLIHGRYNLDSQRVITDFDYLQWINHTYDVRGWFQWYCRFWSKWS